LFIAVFGRLENNKAKTEIELAQFFKVSSFEMLIKDRLMKAKYEISIVTKF